MRPPIPVSAPTPFDAQRALEALASAGLEPVFCAGWDRFRRQTTGADIAVVVAPWLDQYPLARLEDFEAERPWLPIVLLTERPPENLKLLARVRVEAVLFLGTDEAELPAVVRTARGDTAFRTLARALREREDLPGVLRLALARTLEERPPLEPVDAASPKAPARSIRSLARRARCSPDYLSRIARRHDLDLRGFLAWVVALRALQMSADADVTWEQIAWRLGYESVSGLSEHLKSTLGHRPTDLDAADLGRWLGEMRARFHLDRRREEKAGRQPDRVSSSEVGVSEDAAHATVQGSVS